MFEGEVNRRVILIYSRQYEQRNLVIKCVQKSQYECVSGTNTQCSIPWHIKKTCHGSMSWILPPFFASNRKPCKAKERHKRLQVLKCHKLQSAANVLFCPTCSFCFPTFILFFLNICSPSFVSTFPHSCARQPGFGIRVFIRGTVWVSVSVTTQDYTLQAARLSSNILIMNISRI